MSCGYFGVVGFVGASCRLGESGEGALSLAIAGSLGMDMGTPINYPRGAVSSFILSRRG